MESWTAALVVEYMIVCHSGVDQAVAAIHKQQQELKYRLLPSHMNKFGRRRVLGLAFDLPECAEEEKLGRDFENLPCPWQSVLCGVELVRTAKENRATVEQKMKKAGFIAGKDANRGRVEVNLAMSVSTLLTLKRFVSRWRQRYSASLCVLPTLKLLADEMGLRDKDGGYISETEFKVMLRRFRGREHELFAWVKERCSRATGSVAHVGRVRQHSITHLNSQEYLSKLTEMEKRRVRLQAMLESGPTAEPTTSSSHNKDKSSRHLTAIASPLQYPTDGGTTTGGMAQPKSKRRKGFLANPVALAKARVASAMFFSGSYLVQSVCEFTNRYCQYLNSNTSKLAA